MSTRTLIIDPQPSIALGIQETCQQTEFDVCAVSHSLVDAHHQLKSKIFELVFIGTNLAEQTGFQFCQRNRKYLGDSWVLFLAHSNCSSNDVVSAIECGASGLVCRNCTGEELLALMRDVVAGKRLWKKAELKRHVTHRSRIDFENAPNRLTERENDVLLEIARGRTNSETADALGIGYETVKDHVANILRKLEVTDRTQAAIWAVQNNVV